MRLEKAYEIYLLNVNKNGINDNAPADRGRFVTRLYQEYLRYIQYVYEHKNDDTIREIQPLLVNKTKTAKKSADYDYTELPENFFLASSVSATASNGSCTSKLEVLQEIKNFNKDFFLSDEFLKPSFKYREAPYYYSDNKVKIFTNGEFKIKKITLDYYRYPLRPRLIDPEDPESPFDPTIELELGEETINRILLLTSGSFKIAMDDATGQIYLQRTITKT